MVAASRMLKSSALAGFLPLSGALTMEKAVKDQLAPEQGTKACSGVALTFEEYVVAHERGYRPGSEEYSRRQTLFEGRVDHISGHNCADEMPWKAQVNHLTDWTEEELQGLRGYKKAYTEASGWNEATAQLDQEEDPSVPDVLNYDYLNAISQPTDQGSCGSCWAYASTAALNSHAELNNNTNRYSVAQIVACTPNPQKCGGSGGCEGATAELAYEYVLNSGLSLESDFPARPGGSQAACPAEQKASVELLSAGIASKAVIMPDGSERHMLAEGMRGGQALGMLGWTKLPENQEVPLVRALVEYGPLAIAVSAGSDWNWYYHGILTPQGCDHNHVISHAVVLYGYGKATSAKHGEIRYWRIKNSWGRSWGEDGMLRLQRLDEEDKECGWDNQPDVGSGCTGGPSKVWVCGSCGILYDAVLPMFRM